MTANRLRRALSLTAAALLLLSACASPERRPEPPHENPDALTGSGWYEYHAFWELLGRTYPDIQLALSPYDGGNRTGYGWAQMRADDIPDVFITSQILDEDLAAERLADLSGYDLVNRFPTAVLNQVAIDGGVYLLPVNYSM